MTSRVDGGANLITEMKRRSKQIEFLIELAQASSIKSHRLWLFTVIPCLMSRISLHEWHLILI